MCACAFVCVCYTGKKPMHVRHNYKCCVLHRVSHNKNSLEMIFTKPHVMALGWCETKRRWKIHAVAFQFTNACGLFWVKLLELSTFCPALLTSVDRTLLANNFLFLEFSTLSTFLQWKELSKRTKNHFNFDIFEIVQINICICGYVWFSLCCYRVIVSGVNAPKGNISYLHLVDFTALRY